MYKMFCKILIFQKWEAGKGRFFDTRGFHSFLEMCTDIASNLPFLIFMMALQMESDR